MTLKEAQSIIDDLAREFNVSSPTVRFKRRRNGRAARRSDYDGSIPRINLAGWEVSVGAVLHEFAHHMHGAVGWEAHNIIFYWHLTEIIDYYFNGDFAKYPWEMEYKYGQKFFQQVLIPLWLEEVL
jgi:hypothetical protein